MGVKVRLCCREEKREELERMLRAGGFTVSADGELVLTEENFFPDRFLVQNRRGENVLLDREEIVMVESFNHDLIFHSGGKEFRLRERLYVIEGELPADDFVRVNHSAIVNRKKLVKIVPALGSRFELTLEGGIRTSVSRSYYAEFKRRFGI